VICVRQRTLDRRQATGWQRCKPVPTPITPDIHGNAVIELGQDDSTAIPGVSATFLQQNLQSLVHLHA
jgi:hypothetical protein